ncbi:hypothetical protein BCR35DRAFT_349523 [Leucosporidium creatinivorum]|uniref:Arrestin-like N-terminal domain-containing protein n=1 Tax=Leucosporidium creatinivorum TaxID=106004 RepID=A0A1Y2G317_9BASI|nr:hypothetical protein BCR35DRAFT_349523 [Leucosporidium creatinivorum]
MPPLAFLSKPSIKVTLEQEMIFVRPSPSATPSDDPLLRGTVVLSLPKRRAIRAIRIKLEALSDVYGGIDFPYETEKILEKSLHMELDGEVLEAGNHAFGFAFILPSSSAVYQRCSYGRCRHFVRATVDYAGPLKTSSSSSPIAVWVTANPTPLGASPEPLDTSLQHYSSDLGPIAVTLSSPHLTVSSLIHAELHFLSPPQNVTIIHISCLVTQTFVVHYKDPQRIARPIPKRHLLTKVDISAHATPLVPTPSRPIGGAGSCAPLDPVREDPNPLHELKFEEEFRYASLFRVPNDDHIRPTTLAATEAKIRVSHKLVVEVRYRLGYEDEDRLLTISRPVEIASCCCLGDSLLLPAYSVVAPSPSQPLISPRRNRCLCNTSLAEMRTMEGLALERASTIVGTGDSEAERAMEERVEREIAEQRRRSELKTAPGHATAIHLLR